MVVKNEACSLSQPVAITYYLFQEKKMSLVSVLLSSYRGFSDLSKHVFYQLFKW